MMRTVVSTSNDQHGTYFAHLTCGHKVASPTPYHTAKAFTQNLWCDICNHIQLSKSMTNRGGIAGQCDVDSQPITMKYDDPKETSIFTELLNSMQVIHDKKKHDYTSNNDPYGNYRFAGKLSKLFNNPDDAGFVGRIGEKLYRLANLDNSGKNALNESIEDTEVDICTIVILWVASRKERRIKGVNNGPNLETF